MLKKAHTKMENKEIGTIKDITRRKITLMAAISKRIRKETKVTGEEEKIENIESIDIVIE